MAAYTLVVSSIFWLAIKSTIGLRVSKEEEEEGLDLGEHGQEAYVGFAPPVSRAVEVALSAHLTTPAVASRAAGSLIWRTP